MYSEPIENCQTGIIIKINKEFLFILENVEIFMIINKSGKKMKKQQNQKTQQRLRRLKGTLKIDFGKTKTKVKRHVKQMVNIMILFVLLVSIY